MRHLHHSFILARIRIPHLQHPMLSPTHNQILIPQKRHRIHRSLLHHLPQHPILIPTIPPPHLPIPRTQHHPLLRHIHQPINLSYMSLKIPTPTILPHHLYLPSLPSSRYSPITNITNSIFQHICMNTRPTFFRF